MNLDGEIRLLLDAVPDAIVIVDHEGRIRHTNVQGERLFGYTAEELVGQPVEILMPVSARAAHRGHRADFTRTPRTRPMGAALDLVARRKDGTEFPADIGLSSLDTGVGRFVISSVRDISERKRLEGVKVDLAHEQAAREAAESANRWKDELLAVLAHELRTPLTAIMNAVAALGLLGGKDETTGRLRDVIRRQTDHLARLVSDLVDVAHVTAGKMVVALEPMDLGESVKECMTFLTQTGALDHHAVEVQAEPVWIRGDLIRIHQIVTNLVSNATKYTPPGGAIRVEVRGEGDEAVLRVADTGIGIPAELLPNIFDLFTRGSGGADPAVGGLGIGLTLVRTLVAHHGGRVEVRSEGSGRGSEFLVWLPRVAPPARRDEAVEARPGGPRRRVLIVEDNHDVRETLRMVLELAGHEVHEAADGETALEVAARVVPDVALIDLGLPGLDGCEVVRRLRRRGKTTRMLAITGYGRPDDQRRAALAGFDGHLVKPVDPDALLREL